MNNKATNMENSNNQQQSTSLVWEAPVLYKENWINTQKDTGGTEVTTFVVSNPD